MAARVASTALALSALLGCGGDRPPAAPSPDSSPFRDGRVSEAGPDGSALDARGRGDAGPRLPSADIEVVLPYGAPPETRTLTVEAGLASLDVHLSVDTTGSFGEEIDAMQADLRDRIASVLRERVPDVAFGVSRFEDFPRQPFGGPDDHPFELLSPITQDADRVGSAVASLDAPLGNGGDAPESGLEALYQIATGEGLRVGSLTWIPRYSGRAAPGGGTLGGVGFREGALRVVVHITDAPPHEPADYAAEIGPTHSLVEAAAALSEVEARVIGIASSDVARPHLERLAIATRAVVAPSADGSCPTGVAGSTRDAVDGSCPLVFDVERDGTGLSNAITDAIVELVTAVRFDEVHGVAVDDPLGFLRAIEARDAVTPPGVTPPTTDDLHPSGDGVLDTFLSVGPGTRMTFRLSFENVVIRQSDYDQVFRLSVEIVGDGLVLTRRTIRVIVPRGRADGGPAAMDAGPEAGPSTDGASASDGSSGDG